jgi:YidC/Oxa1 family membrane protein insertase
MPKEALEGPFAQQQKVLLYVLPLVFAFSGVYFPLGTVLYWLVSNLWTMGQQLFVIRRMPAPGTDAERAHQQRMESKARRRGRLAPGDVVPGSPGSPGSPAPDSTPTPEPTRVQPKKTTRSQRKGKK